MLSWRFAKKMIFMATLTAATSMSNRLIAARCSAAVPQCRDAVQRRAGRCDVLIECRTRSGHQRLSSCGDGGCCRGGRQFLIVAIIITVICMTLCAAGYGRVPPMGPPSSDHIGRARGELLKRFAIYATRSLPFGCRLKPS